MKGQLLLRKDKVAEIKGGNGNSQGHSLVL